MSAPKRREGVRFLQARGLSERRSCQLVGISRSSFRYQAHPRPDQPLQDRLRAISQKRRRFGYRRAAEIVRREGIVANHKRIYRLWRQEGLCLPRRRRRKRGYRADPIPCTAAHPGHVWTYDFIHDACSNGRKLKILTVEDEFTRECLALVPETSLRSNKVIAVLERLFAAHGPPQFIRSDNGPEFIARLVQRRLVQQHTQTVYIEPGKPWQNGFVESLHGKLRDECLSMEVFASVREAKVITETWRQDYNQERPHSSLGNLTPLEFKAAWQQAQGAGGGPELEFGA